MTDTTPQPEKDTILIAVPELKQMIAWSLLCLGIIKTKNEDFDVTPTEGGVVVRTLRGR
jgi:hypothetical protein